VMTSLFGSVCSLQRRWIMHQVIITMH
jgi:hypothetical protein